ncbi:hypothetical protein SORBI_3008G070200, partial [Sorghum bicolor]
VVPCPSALEAFEEIIGLANNNEIAVFLDYDGTLSPIVNDPEKAYMSSEMRQVLKAIAENFKTSIVSGRAREKVFEFVQIDTINYAGSHGTDIKMASTTWGEITEEHDSYQPAKKFATVMNQVYNSLVRETGHINGAKVENNTYCVSVHYRNVAKEDQLRVLHVVQEVLKNLNSGLDLTYGHMVYEIRPPLAFNKGNAVAYILDKLGLDFSIYIGDDLTDEDAFKVIRDRKKGIRILVSNTSRETSAFYSLKDPPQVMEFLKLLLSWKLKKIK